MQLHTFVKTLRITHFKYVQFRLLYFNDNSIKSLENVDVLRLDFQGGGQLGKVDKLHLSNSRDCMTGSAALRNSLLLGSGGCVSRDWCPGPIRAVRKITGSPNGVGGHHGAVACDCSRPCRGAGVPLPPGPSKERQD